MRLKKNLSEGLSRELAHVRVNISGFFLRNTISIWSCILDVKNRRQNGAKALII